MPLGQWDLRGKTAPFNVSIVASRALARTSATISSECKSREWFTLLNQNILVNNTNKPLCINLQMLTKSLIRGRKSLCFKITPVSLISSSRCYSSSSRQTRLLLNQNFPSPAYCGSSGSVFLGSSYQQKSIGPFFSLKSSHTMASQSKTSVHEYVVKVCRRAAVSLL